MRRNCRVASNNLRDHARECLHSIARLLNWKSLTMELKSVLMNATFL